MINDLATDQRVNKTCMVLRELGFDVLLVGRIKNDSPPLPTSPYRMHRMKLLFEKGPLFYAEYNIRLFFLLFFRKADLLFSNDLDTLLPNYLISRVNRIHLVYDSHEYFTETPELVNRKFIQNIWKTIEGWIFPKLKDVITVNESIAGLYKKKYHVDVHVVRNIPPAPKPSKIKSRKELNMPENKAVVLLQGSGINIQRGGEEMVEAMQFLAGIQLYIIGGGDVIEILKKMSHDLELAQKITFLPRMPFEDLQHYTANADIGLSLDKDTNINYRFSLPNKLFDYINAGVPVLASPLVEVKKIIGKYRVGETIDTHDPDHLAEKVKNMLGKRDNLEKYRRNCLEAAKHLNWENEKQILIKILKKYA